MAVCSKCNRVIRAGAKACHVCGAPLPIGTAKKKDLLQPKMSIEDALQKTNTDIVRAKLPVKKMFLISLGVLLAIGLLYVAKSAMVIFDGSGKEYQAKIFYDPIWGLMWAKAHHEEKRYADAAQVCDELKIGKIDDWRVPTITELRTLIKGCTDTGTKGKCAVHDACPRPDCRTEPCAGCEAEKGGGEDNLYWLPRIWEHAAGGSKQVYWSSTESKDIADEGSSGKKEQWAVSFVTGAISAKDAEEWGHVRCVSGPVKASERLKQYFMFLK